MTSGGAAAVAVPSDRAHIVERHLAQLKKEGREESVEERVAFSQKHFGKLPNAPMSSDEANAGTA
mgnify:CR=1 FL=1